MGGWGLCEGVSGGGFTPGGFFRFQPADLPADFFGGFFLCMLRPKNPTAKSTAPWRVLVSEIPRP